MDKKNRIKWTNKFRTLGKNKGARQDFIKLYTNFYLIYIIKFNKNYYL